METLSLVYVVEFTAKQCAECGKLLYRTSFGKRLLSSESTIERINELIRASATMQDANNSGFELFFVFVRQS
jgi:hypothetical protein